MAPLAERGAARDRRIDALRALCLLGIALVNAPWIGLVRSLPSLLWSAPLRAELTPVDLAAAGFVELLCEGRFYPQFAMLFGLGTAIVLDRGFDTILRRLAFLSVIGIHHAMFGWWGDILVDYALVGLVLVALAWPRRHGSLHLALSIAIMIASIPLAAIYDDWLVPSVPATLTLTAHEAELVTTYRDSGFATITSHRVEDLLDFFAPYNWTYRLNTLAMGALGYWLGARPKSGETRRYQRLIDAPDDGFTPSSLAHLAFALGVIGVMSAASVPFVPALYIIAGNAMGLAYATTWCWLASRPSLAALVDRLAVLGRMSMSAYLFQTVCFTLVFYGYGLGFYGRVGPAGVTGLAIAVWAASWMVALTWSRWFRLGPFEWLWRSFSEGRWVALRLDAEG